MRLKRVILLAPLTVLLLGLLTLVHLPSGMARPQDCADICTWSTSCSEVCWDEYRETTCGDWGVCDYPTPPTPTPTPDPCQPDKVYFGGSSGLFLDFLCEYFGNLPNVGYRQIAYAEAKTKFETMYGSGSWERSCDSSGPYPNGCWYVKYQAYTYEWFCTLSARPPK